MLDQSECLFSYSKPALLELDSFIHLSVAFAALTSTVVPDLACCGLVSKSVPNHTHVLSKGHSTILAAKRERWKIGHIDAHGSRHG